jgi:hypothetical protein
VLRGGEGLQEEKHGEAGGALKALKETPNMML